MFSFPKFFLIFFLSFLIFPSFREENVTQHSPPPQKKKQKNKNKQNNMTYKGRMDLFHLHILENVKF